MTGNTKGNKDMGEREDNKQQVQVLQSDDRKRKLWGMYAGGMTPAEIAKKMGCSVKTCHTVIKVLKGEMAMLSPSILRDTVRQSFVSLLSSYQVRATELFNELVDAQSARDSFTSEDRVRLALAKHSADGEIRAICAAMQRNDDSFISLIERMGVPRSDVERDNREPTQGAILYENPNLSKADAMKQLEASVNRSRNYINTKKKAEKEKSDES